MDPGVIVRNLVSAIADKPTGSPAIAFQDTVNVLGCVFRLFKEGRVMQ